MMRLWSRYGETFAVWWACIKPWLGKNWLRLLLFIVLLLFEMGLAMGLIPTRDGTIYWWTIYPKLYVNTVEVVALAAMLASFTLWPVTWFARAGILVLLLIMQPIAWGHALGMTNLFTHEEHVNSVSFQGRVYHLSFENGISGEPYDAYFVYECDSIGFWCHQIDRFEVGEASDPYDVALIGDADHHVLYMTWVNPVTGKIRIVREYTLIDRSSQEQNLPR